MIVRNHLKGEHHKQLEGKIQDLRIQNRQLRTSILRLEQRLMEEQSAKRKYKHKYRQAKQKIQILGLVGIYSNSHKDYFDGGISPKTKTTRIKTASEDDFHNLKFGLAQSELEENISTKPYIIQTNDYLTSFGSKKNLTPATSTRESETQREEPKLLQNLIKIHEQLDKLSLQIQQKTNTTPNTLILENQLYRKMEQVVDKINQLELRDLEKQNIRAAKEKERNGKRYNSSMKAIELVGKSLVQFKVDE